MNYRHNTACLIVLLGVLGIVPTSHATSISDAAARVSGTQSAASPQTPPAVTQLDGRLHPELVPPEIAWEHFFRAMVVAGFEQPDDVEPSAEIVEALSKHNLFIPRTQARIVLLVAKATVAKLEELGRPLDQEGQGKVRLGWTKARRQSVLKEMTATVLSGRDELVTLLPRKDMAAVDRYIVTTIIPSVRTRIIK